MSPGIEEEEIVADVMPPIKYNRSSQTISGLASLNILYDIKYCNNVIRTM